MKLRGILGKNEIIDTTIRKDKLPFWEYIPVRKFIITIICLIWLIIALSVRGSNIEPAPPPTITPLPTLTYTATRTPSPTFTNTATATPSPTSKPNVASSVIANMPTSAPCTGTPVPAMSASNATPTLPPFIVYTEFGNVDNHFTPSGYIGDIDDLQMFPDDQHCPKSGKHAIKIVYTPRGKNSKCGFTPCRWAGIIWQEPPDNFGLEPVKGFSLTGYTKVTFWARSDSDPLVEFKVGGTSVNLLSTPLPYPSSVVPARTTNPREITLTSQWQQYEIDLQGANLTNVIDGFVFVISADRNGISISENPTEQIVVYLDDIQYE